ncbi:MBL fold metallo-hydrolase [Neiella marina]|uniref:MBL fold metallo-hydrolase n=1 Tax=Neiella holothuriorum TaxID=2870530 RepID=A0ABS7EK18_9GAMM|nr:MBL fold metallo-hydrolase [Neiella holothuriorum]MBW8192703.1 MBL fold metallo-hydrolase [Neiella holothuriorum]
MNYHIIPVTDFMQNCTILWCEQSKDAAIVDPGGDAQSLVAYIEQQQLTVRKILLTHAHIDHAGATAELAAKFDCPIEGPHQDDKFWIDALPQQSQMFGFPKVDGFSPTRWLNQGDEITVGQHTLEVRHCPGHTPGHVVFVDQAAKFAIVGDVIFKNSIGRTDFPKGDHATLINAIKQQILSLPDDMTLLPGHGPTTTVARERQNNPYIR